MTKSELALDFRGASSKKAPQQRGVCVEHLNRCKLLTADVTFLLISFLPLGNRNLPTIRFSWMFFHFISLHFTSFHFHFISFHFHFHFHFISFHFIFVIQQGATAPFISPWPTKLLMFGEDMQFDQLHVPASFFSISLNGNRLSLEPA